MKNEIIRDVNNRVVGICRKESIELCGYGAFSIYGTDMDNPVDILCSPENLEKLHCSCGGELRITDMNDANFGRSLDVELSCDKCSGKYIGISQKKNKGRKNG